MRSQCGAGAAEGTPLVVELAPTRREAPPSIVRPNVMTSLEVVSGTPRLRELAAAAMACAARQAPGRADVPPAGELRAILRRTCDAARAEGLRAEQLLLVLKAEWRRLPPELLAWRDADADRLARAITFCIAEYYAPHGPR